MILTIERAKWRRGGVHDRTQLQRGQEFNEAPRRAPELGETLLLNEKGFMCCLGFDALACGLRPVQIQGKADPQDIWGRDHVRAVGDDAVFIAYVQGRIVREDDGFDHTQAVKDAIVANDDEFITDDVREQRVREALMGLGYEDVRFV